MYPLRVSAISFLNTAPLMWDFEHAKHPEFEIDYTVPSKCAQALADGRADIGLIPAAEYAVIPGLRIVPDVAIAAKGAVRSILLISKTPIEDARSIAVDTSSRTSVALTQVLLEKKFGGKRPMAPMAPLLKPMLREHDAALLIGDPALLCQPLGCKVYDLAHEWRTLTGKPFVFAFWAVREAKLGAIPAERLAQTFQRSRDHGLSRIDEIVTQWTSRIQLSADVIRTYLTQNINYFLDEDNLAGLELFYRYAHDCGAIPKPPGLRFI